MNYKDQPDARNMHENSTVNNDREKNSGNPTSGDLRTELITRRVQILLAFQQASSNARARHAKEWSTLEGLYHQIEKALETDDLELLEHAKAAYAACTRQLIASCSPGPIGQNLPLGSC